MDKYNYGCSAAKDRGPEVCGNGMKVAVKVADRELLDAIRTQIDTDEAMAEYQKEASALLRAEKRGAGKDEARTRRAAVEREIANMVAAIRAGAFSDRLKAELAAAEAEQAALHAQLASRNALDSLSDILPQAATRWRARLIDMADHPAG